MPPCAKNAPVLSKFSPLLPNRFCEQFDKKESIFEARMQSEYPKALDTSLAELDWSPWLDRMCELAQDDGYAERLGENHAAIFIENSPTLFVTFESFPEIGAISEAQRPFGWQLARAQGWSHLCLACKSDTWFREPRVYGYFDRLIDDGFFDEFEQVIFYGAGACGYAAAAFSVAAPGAKVFLIQPQATLDPRLAEWDQRFRYKRRTDFISRYGYAPDMLDACSKGILLYDPNIDEDAMHAALFARSNLLRFRMRHMGALLDRGLLRMEILADLVAGFADDSLTVPAIGRAFRARRNYVLYLKGLLARLEDEGRVYQISRLCQFAMRNTPGPRFRKALKAAYERAKETGVDMPPDGSEA